MRAVHTRAAIAAAIGLVAVGSVAKAALTIDLRFTDGTHSKTPAAGNFTPITIQMWAVVTGTAGNAQPDGLQSAIAAIKSNVLVAGSAGSITSATLATGWAGTGSSAGSSSNISNDSIGDWGNVTNTPLTITAAMGYFRARTTKSADNQIDWGDNQSPTGATYNTLADGGAEFLVGTFAYTPTAGNGMIQFVPVTPAGGFAATAGWWEDTADKTAGSPTGSRSNSTGTYGPVTPNSGSINAVTIGVPEPTSLGFAGISALIVLRRNRNSTTSANASQAAPMRVN